jgi:hypothetical protein
VGVVPAAGAGVGVARVVELPVVELPEEPLVVPAPVAALVGAPLVVPSGVLPPPTSPPPDVVVLVVGDGLGDALAAARSFVTTSCAWAWRSDVSGR